MNKLAIALILTICATTANAQTSEQLVEWISVPTGWTKGETVEVFNPDNLHERINGAAYAFLACKFVEMTTLDLVNNNDSKTYINVSMYLHASPADAYCVYSGERTPDVDFVDIGAEGYVTGSALLYVSGPIYVKIRSHSTDPEVLAAIRSIGQQLAKKIDPHAKLPRILGCFPTENKVAHSETYISESYLGHSYLHSAYQVSYKKEENEYSIFIIECENVDDAKKMVASYFKTAKKNEEIREGVVTINDPYNGEICLSLKKNYLIGITLDKAKGIDTEGIIKGIESRIFLNE